jgi:hypothetical protein
LKKMGAKAHTNRVNGIEALPNQSYKNLERKK